MEYKSFIDGKELKSLKSLLAYDGKRGLTKEDIIAKLYYEGIRKKCKCGCGEETKYNTRTRDLSDYIRGHQARVWNPTRDDVEIAQRASKKMVETNKKKIQEGTYKPWNKGLTEEDPRIKKYIDKHRGKKRPKETGEKIRKKMNERIKRMKEEGTYDSEFNKHFKEYWAEPKNRLEQAKRTTDRLIKNDYNMKISLKEKEFIKLLDSKKIKYKHQFRLCNKLFDFKIGNILIEIDGDFHHANPEKYPEGPIYPIQVKTCENDKLKNNIAKKEGYKLIRIWTSNIDSNDTLKIIEGLKKPLKFKIK